MKNLKVKFALLGRLLSTDEDLVVLSCGGDLVFELVTPL
jgi:hypothetical protein